jgi:heme-degrading monooxygenase HmoA
MIVRIWRGRTKATQADGYTEYMKQTGIDGLRRTPGNRRAMILRSDGADETEFLVVSFWDTMESILAFAGERPEEAVYYPEDDRYLLEMERTVRHYEVAVDAGG